MDRSFFGQVSAFTLLLFSKYFYECIDGRALPDITSGPEVRQIVKIRTVRKPDVFLTGRRTLTFLEIEK